MFRDGHIDKTINFEYIFENWPGDNKSAVRIIFRIIPVVQENNLSPVLIDNVLDSRARKDSMGFRALL